MGNNEAFFPAISSEDVANSFGELSDCMGELMVLLKTIHLHPEATIEIKRLAKLGERVALDFGSFASVQQCEVKEGGIREMTAEVSHG